MDCNWTLNPQHEGLRTSDEAYAAAIRQEEEGLQRERRWLQQAQECVTARLADWDARLLQLRNHWESLQLPPPRQVEVGPPHLDPTVKEEDRLPPPHGRVEIKPEPDYSPSSVHRFQPRPPTPVGSESEDESEEGPGPNAVLDQLQDLQRAFEAEERRIRFQRGPKPGPPNPPSQLAWRPVPAPRTRLWSAYRPVGEPPPPPHVLAEREGDTDEGGPDHSSSPVLDIGVIMNQMQSLQGAVEALHSQYGSNPPPTPTWPPGPPPGAHPQSRYQLQPPLPPPGSSGSTVPAWETPRLTAAPESNSRGPRPSIPKLTCGDPAEFVRLKMALEDLLPPESTETFKYRILLDHLQLEEAKMIADAYLHSTTPFSDAMKALTNKLGQPHQLALGRITDVMETPDICRGDAAAFARFAIQVQSLVGILKTLGPDGAVELQCSSHVARLMSRLPAEQRYEFRRYVRNRPGQTCTLGDLADWLEDETSCRDFVELSTPRSTKEKPEARSNEPRAASLSTSVTGITGPPSHCPSKRKYGEQMEDQMNSDDDHMAKMRLFASQMVRPSAGNNRNEHWSYNPIPVDHLSASNSLHGNHLFASIPGFAVDQPLALTKSTVDPDAGGRDMPVTAGSAQRQQNRPSVIICAPASNRNCNLSHCHMNGSSSQESDQKKADDQTECDPVIEEHFRRSLGKNYTEPESNSVSITGSVDDHFAKALGATWLQIKAKGGGPVPQRQTHEPEG